MLPEISCPTLLKATTSSWLAPNFTPVKRSVYPHRIHMAVSDFFYKIEDLRRGQPDDIHAFNSNLFRDKEIHETIMISDFLQFETGIAVFDNLVLKKA